MQFSIRRPKLPSCEAHPEESLYRRLDVPAWLQHLNELGQVEEMYKLRQVRAARGGRRRRAGAPPGPPRARFAASARPSDPSRGAGTIRAAGIRVSLHRGPRAERRPFQTRGLGRDVRTARQSERAPGGH